MTITNQTDKNVDFTPTIPGMYITDAIEHVIKYCQKNSVNATLNFNGTTRPIDIFSDSKFLSNIWFSREFDEKVKNHKMDMRDSKIDSILK